MSRLEVTRLTVGYPGGPPVLHDLSLVADDGAIVTIFGANGAGKSTLMRTLAGQLRPRAGTITLDGEDVTGASAHARASRGVRLIPQGHEPFGNLSVQENVEMGAYLLPRRRARAAVEESLARFPRLLERRHLDASALSGGERAMLGLARALVAEPRLLLLDEPSIGLSPRAMSEFFGVLEDARSPDRSMLLVEQNVGHSLQLADYVYVLEQGRIVAQGSRSSFESTEQISRAYLGSHSPDPVAAAFTDHTSAPGARSSKEG